MHESTSHKQSKQCNPSPRIWHPARIRRIRSCNCLDEFSLLFAFLLSVVVAADDVSGSVAVTFFACVCAGLWSIWLWHELAIKHAQGMEANNFTRLGQSQGFDGYINLPVSWKLKAASSCGLVSSFSHATQEKKRDKDERRQIQHVSQWHKRRMRHGLGAFALKDVSDETIIHGN